MLTTRPLVVALACALAFGAGACSDNNTGGETTTDMAATADMATMDMATADMASPDMGEDMGADMAVDMGGEDMGQGCAWSGTPEPGMAKTTSGPVRGVASGDTWAFLGMPFAKPPVGALRWRPPEPTDCWAPQVRDASAFGPKCPQREGVKVVGEEDCLTLNVWTPKADAPASGRPVMVFIHGGGNIVGSAVNELPGGAKMFDGARLATAQGAVVVTIQYRLGALGFLTSSGLRDEDADGHTGNYGTLDQVAALRWVNQNIASFGGDPGRVMVFGESAGAVNTCMMVATPMAKGLFQAALMQSGNCPGAPVAEAITAVDAAITQTSCADAADRNACLRALSAEEVVKAFPAKIGVGGSGGASDALTFGPVVDGWVLPKAPLALFRAGEHNDVAFVIGSNADEMASEAIFSLEVSTAEEYRQTIRSTLTALGRPESDALRVLALYPANSYDTPQDALIQVFTDANFTCNTRTIARTIAASQQSPVWRYFFRRRATTRNGANPAAHGVELLYVFGSLFDIPLYTPAAEDQALSATMMNLWGHLASDQDPNYTGLSVTWPVYAANTETSLVLDGALSVEDGVRGERCDLWDELLAAP